MALCWQSVAGFMMAVLLLLAQGCVSNTLGEDVAISVVRKAIARQPGGEVLSIDRQFGIGAVDKIVLLMEFKDLAQYSESYDSVVRCLRPLDDDFEVGRGVCYRQRRNKDETTRIIEYPTANLPITAGHTEQRCKGDVVQELEKEWPVIYIPGTKIPCTGIVVKFHTFDPPISGLLEPISSGGEG